MKAESFIKDPPDTLKEVIAEVQETANRTQSEAWHLHAAGDGSVVEVRCAPEPRYRGELPEASEDSHGTLAEKGGKLYRAEGKIVARAKTVQDALSEDDGKRYRAVLQLGPKLEIPKTDEAGRIVTSGPREDAQTEYALVEFEWVEVEPDWAQHALKKAADVRLTARPSARIPR